MQSKKYQEGKSVTVGVKSPILIFPLLQQRLFGA